MKILMIVLTLINLAFATPIYAVSNQSEISIVKVGINGLVCDFCARALEKVFGRQESVTGIDVNLDSKIVTINFKGAPLDDEVITKMINDSGYDVREINRHE